MRYSAKLNTKRPNKNIEIKLKILKPVQSTCKKYLVPTISGMMKILNHLLCENISKKSVSNMRGELTNSQ